MSNLKKTYFIIFLFFLFKDNLQAKIPTLSPALMGANALPVPLIYSKILSEHKTTFEFKLIQHYEREKELTTNPRFEFFIPWGKYATFRLFMIPIEYYKTSKIVAKKRGALNTSGFSKGDIYFGSTFKLYQNKNNSFFCWLNLITKTTSGKNLKNARFFNSPAYLMDITFLKKDFWKTKYLKQINLSAYTSFIAWQSSFNQQNDAFGFAMKLDLIVDEINNINVESSMYHGWQNNGDFPIISRIGYARKIKNYTVHMHYQRAHQDYIAHSLEIGSSYFFQ